MKNISSIFRISLFVFALLFSACKGNDNGSGSSGPATDDPGTAKKTVEEKATAENLGKPTTYKVAVRTGCKDDASTKAAVTLKIIGEGGTTDEFLLRNLTADNFLSCSNDIFELEVPADVGQINEVQMWHDNQGEDPSWLVELIKIENKRTGVRWMFPCGKWFDKDKYDQKIRRSFFPGKMCD